MSEPLCSQDTGSPDNSGELPRVAAVTTCTSHAPVVVKDSVTAAATGTFEQPRVRPFPASTRGQPAYSRDDDDVFCVQTGPGPSYNPLVTAADTPCHPPVMSDSRRLPKHAIVPSIRLLKPPGAAQAGRTHIRSTRSLPRQENTAVTSPTWNTSVTSPRRRCFSDPPRKNNGAYGGGTSRRNAKPQRLPSLRNDPVTSFRTSQQASDTSSYPTYCYTPTNGQPFLQRSKSEDCIKCMLKVAHKKCEGHKYIRIGGGYRHSFWYCKALLEELELQRQKKLIREQRLEAIHEGRHGLRAIKTYIRTKSGRLVEKIVWLNEDDYQAFKAGGEGAADVLKKYLSKDEAKGLESWDKDEQKAITTWIRTKSGKLIKKEVFISKADYDLLKEGKLDAESVMKKYLKKGEKVEGWEETKMQAIKTYVRTKSGRLVEKTLLVSQEDYDKMMELKRQGKDPNEILNKYMTLDDGEKIEGFEKKESPPMKVVKAMVRTKSGRMVEKTILMTEEEYKEFMDAGGDPNHLRKFLDIGKDDVIEDWDKASTVFSAGSDAEQLAKAAPGTRVIGKDGKVYEVVVDPITGKKYKKLVGEAVKVKKKKGLMPKGGDDDPNEKGMTEKQKAEYRIGKRRDGSDSEFSYKSHVSDGGTRHVRRRRKRADGTYSDSDSYHSDQDETGRARRQKRRKDKKIQAVKAQKEAYKKGKRNPDSDSEFSYRSVVSAGGTRHVRRRRKRADGTYSGSDSYHSGQDEAGTKRRKARRAQREKAFRQGKRNPDSDSEFSYKSYVSDGGRRHVRRRRKRADGTYSGSDSYHSSQDEGGKGRRRQRRDERKKALKKGKRNAGSDSDYSYRSAVSAGGTRHVRRRRKRADGTYSGSDSYHSGQDEEGMARRRRRRRERDHAGSAHSYFSVESEGGTRHVRRRRKREDGTYSASEAYESDEDGGAFGKKGKKGKKGRRDHGSESDYSYYSEVSAGGTHHRKRKKRVRDKYGNITGHGKDEEYTSDSDVSYDMVADGKGGFKKVIKKGKYGERKRRDVFGGSLASTDSEDEPDLSKMTTEEREQYLTEKAKRKAEREIRRKEKFGDKYDEMVEKHKKQKEEKKVAKSMVSYEKGGSRFKKDEWDDRQPGMGWEEYTDEHGRKARRRKGSDGNVIEEFVDEHGNIVRRTKKGDEIIEEYVDKHGNVVRKIKKADGSEFEEVVDKDGLVTRRRLKSADEESLYEYEKDADGNYVYDKDGNPIRRKIGTIKKGKVGKDGIVDEDDEFVYKYDKDGNLVRLKKGQKEPEEKDNGDYFEVGADGKLKLKKGKKKIDISKLSEEELKALGIDLKNMTKEEIARILKEKFGDDIQIVKGGQKIGLKNIDDYGSDANTEDLANDSDLDISTLTGAQRVRVLLKRGGQALMDHMKKVIEQSQLVDNVHPDEKDQSIDFLKHYQLVENTKLDSYARAFVIEDDDYDGVVYPRDARMALENVPSVKEITEKQMQFVLKLLDIDRETNVTFRMFAVMTALAERVTSMDKHCKKLLEISELSDIERKLGLYKSMFYCNVSSDHDPNYIQSDCLKIELMAGGLSPKQQDYVMSKFTETEWGEISFLDYLVYIPLFMSMHDNMCNNPLDNSSSKYNNRQASAAQRDQNPLGHHLTKDSPFIQTNSQTTDVHTTAKDILAGRDTGKVKQDTQDLFNKYQKLPHISNQSHPSTAKKH